MNSDQNYFNEKKSILEQLILNGSQNLTPLLACHYPQFLTMAIPANMS